jgi:hypothetical protein
MSSEFGLRPFLLQGSSFRTFCRSYTPRYFRNSHSEFKPSFELRIPHSDLPITPRPAAA